MEPELIKTLWVFTGICVAAAIILTVVIGGAVIILL